MVERNLTEVWDQLMSLENKAELGTVELLADELAIIRHTVESIMAEINIAVPQFRPSHGG